MKTVKIDFSGFWPGFDKEDNFITKILRERYLVELANTPDYLFYSIFSKDFLKYDCIRIFYTGECITPDFNLCDYAMGFDWLSFGDRYVRVPLYLLYPEAACKENRGELAKEWYDKKSEFCSFVYSNAGASPIRSELFRAINAYKPVNSGGKYLNTVGGPVADKRAFEEKHLFSIACENSSYAGYTTEKLPQAFCAHAVPIYWGDPLVGKVFNEKAFVNCHAYDKIEDVTERIRELDQERQKYMEMLSQPIWRTGFTPEEQLETVRGFLHRIAEQPLEAAKRRNDSFWGTIYEKEQKKVLTGSSMKHKLKALIERS